jgi:hypothetical protein
MPSPDYVPCYLGDEVYAIYDTRLEQVGLSVGERNEPDIWINPSVLQALNHYASTRNPLFGTAPTHGKSFVHSSPVIRRALGIN